MRGLTGFFADLAVGKKLLTGFGVVLLLTLVVAFSGFYAVDAVLSRNAYMSQIGEINRLVLQAQRYEKEYLLKSEALSANLVRELLAETDRRLDALIGEQAQDSQRLRQMQQAAGDYLQRFESSVKLQQSAGQALAVMEEAGLQAREQFERIELVLYDEVREIRLRNEDLRGSDPLTLAETASGLFKRMLDLRGHESQFIIAGSAQAATDWEAVADEMRVMARNLSIWLNPEQKRSIKTAVAALQTYQDAFAAYRQTVAEGETNARQMAESAGEVLAMAEQASGAQVTAMQAESLQMELLLAAASLAAIIIGVGASLLIRRLIVAPLLQTVSAAQRVASGDLTQDIRLDRQDELGQLQAAMQSMTGSLRGLIGRIGAGVGQIAAAAEQLSAITAQTSAGVQTQKQETEQTATAMHEMAATVQEVAQNAEQASLAARKADQESQQGNRVVQQAVGQIGELAGQVEQSAEAITALNQESARIGGVLEVIRNVAEQTNLLALNAAIEAARAGEQGRGFAVVADEVRALAQRAHKSTEEIEALIAGLQRMALGAVQQMESSRSLTQRTVTLAGEAGDALGRITQAVSTIEQMNQQIAAAAEEQSAVAETISESITRVRDIGEQSASASQQTAASSAELARLGVELQGLVGQFRT
ncbi:methyl-accepting chemotaxis protein [Pseudomonas benzenivorans]|uniref:Methyl-accepting chemotaxis protein n=2 Tax=Pseudomonas benzenivorans TaxID=556533 RepID=A0ABY5H5E0_9PSED|nr:methyl-accepting chemotaxis protein [Pseudomonas benzenivorans]UTW07527.1 methyl-accepting chemotaxis protein [Pseudomonas benzenivorans]